MITLSISIWPFKKVMRFDSKPLICSLDCDLNDWNSDNTYFILIYELIKLNICNTMINQYSHIQGNYIMTYI